MKIHPLFPVSAALLLTVSGLMSAASPADAASVTCSTSSCLQTALANAAPGDTITLAAGAQLNGNFVAAANGTAAAPITLQSASVSNKATLDGGGTGSGYTLHVTGDHWVIKNLKVKNAKKGIVLDHANYTLIDGAEVFQIGEEGVHYRDGSSNNTIQNSYIHDVGLVNAGFGEGVYVGSDQGKWSTFNKSTNDNRIVGNTIGPGVTAEHIDIKEGSERTLVENNIFNGTGISGANYADSFIDVKGNGDVIRGNTGYRNGNSKIVDAFQVHERVTGWGKNASFVDNVLHLDNSAAYVVNADAGATATASGNTRTPSGNMYKGNVTASASGASKAALTASSVTASTHDGNVPGNTIDGSLATRWSAQGDGQWIAYQLSAAQTVDYVKLAWHQGSSRTSSFDIQLSMNGSTWTTVYSGTSSGGTTGLETVDFPDALAGHIRIVGHGNSVNTWNSITEAEIWVK
ncbi:Right handed beta helix region [Paenibacillus sp. UNCCL117]|uniref:discoidin domain-containing protein n=1 Tax=unclassified Paenibacillus TaxID=185978 RepID=UPI00087EB8D8|nr:MULTISPECIES: discoidin domain-containing protein [unclassified Paenibacillus]SDD58741.1 Right handed beta helix region [Paenibacillus sp. cl123]SFW50954.1 Right handed beta helix region [Paenibacillus sp. UNCCL117]